MTGLTEAAALLGLLSEPGIGPASVMRLYEWADTKGVGITEALADPEGRRFALRRKHELDLDAVGRHAAEDFAALESRGVHLIHFRDPRYPALLHSRLVRHSPPLLMVLGNIDVLHRRSVGFCGSRKASEKGLSVAADCAEQLAKSDINVISGYATGVDMATHATALKSGGTTTIVLAEGILNFKLKSEIARLWDWTRVAVVSEFAPRMRWQVHSAMQRNKTICALSQAMVLIEARTSGGSIEAGKVALGLGIALFAAVYDGMPEWATGNRALLQSGAHALLKSRATSRANIQPLLCA